MQAWGLESVDVRRLPHQHVAYTDHALTRCARDEARALSPNVWLCVALSSNQKYARERYAR